MIKTGSLQNLKNVLEESDKVYIITRSDLFARELERAEAEVDGEKLIYLPELSPSRTLLDTYHSYTRINGESIQGFESFYVPHFIDEIEHRDGSKELIRKIAIESLKKDVTLVCFCPDELTCHRRLVKDMVLREQNKILHRIMTPIIVAGSRDFDNYELLRKVIDDVITRNDIKNPIIVEGGAKGADTLAKKYAKEHHLNLKEFPADWETHGRSAGYKRNRQMHIYASDFTNKYCICFWNHNSKGTEQNFNLAASARENDLILVKDENEIFKLNRLGWFEETYSLSDLVHFGHWDSESNEIIVDPEGEEISYPEYMNPMAGVIDYEH